MKKSKMLEKVCLFTILSTFMLMVPMTATGEELYGITFSDKLISINSSTGVGSVIGNLDSIMAGFGLGSYGGKLYAFDQQADRIRQLDPLNGQTLNTYDVGIATVGEGGLTFNASGIGYLSVSSGDFGSLWSFNLQTLTSTLLVNNQLGWNLDGLEFDASGVLYAKQQSNGDIYTIDTNTLTKSLYRDNAFAEDSVVISGLTFGSTGVMYYEHSGYLYANNVQVGTIGFDDVSGLSSMTTSVPEPATLLLLGLGLIGLTGIRRKRQ